MASSPDILYADSQDPGITEVYIDMENVDHEEPIEEGNAAAQEIVNTYLNQPLLPREEEDSTTNVLIKSTTRAMTQHIVSKEETPTKSTSSPSSAARSSSSMVNKPLKPIAPKLSSPASPAKLLVPVQSAIKARTPLKNVSGCNSSSATTTTTTSTHLLITSGADGPAQLIMLPMLSQQPTITPGRSDQLVATTPTASIMTPITPVSAKYSRIQVTPTSSTPIKPVTLINHKQTSSTPQKTNFVPIAPNPMTSQTSTFTTSQLLAGLSSSKIQNGPKMDNDPNRPRKPCNCTKSQCLKLYCECFANGEFCNSCNCINCANNLKCEEERQKAIKQCLERNPHAFHPKIGKSRGDMMERRHTKGCNCRRSGCLKNYCECYEAKILCSELCKCVSCKNYEDSCERKNLMHLADAAEVRSAQQSVASKSHLCGDDFRAKLPVFVTDKVERLHCSFMTNDVIETTGECLLAQAENAQKNGLNQVEIEKLVLEEFGRCIRKIIEAANNSRAIAKTEGL